MGRPAIDLRTDTVRTDLDGPELEKALRRGEVVLSPDRLPDGRIELMIDDELYETPVSEMREQFRRAEARGATVRIPTQEEAARYRAGLSPVRAAVEGAARGVSANPVFSAINAALAARGLAQGETFADSVQIALSAGVNPEEIVRTREQTRRDIELRSDENAVASTVGEVAGFLAGTAVPGAGTGAVVRAGSAAERALVRQTGSKTLGFVAGGAAEGGIYGLSRGATEAALGDPAAAAERVVADGLAAALIPGIIGGAGDVTGLLARRVSSGGSVDDAVRLYARQTGAAPANPGKVARGVEKVYDATTDLADLTQPGKKRDLIMAAIAPTKRGRALRARLYGGRDLRDDVVRDLSELVEEGENLTNGFASQAVGQFKKKRVAAVIKKGNEGEVLEAADGILESYRQKIAGMEALPDEFHTGTINKGKRALAAARSRLRNAALEGPDAWNTEVFATLDRLKQDTGVVARYGKAFGSTLNERDTLEVFDGLYKDLRKHLETDTLYGDAAVLQRRVNGAWSRYLDNQQAFQQKFMVRTGYGSDGRPTFAVDRTKLTTFVDQIDRAKGEHRIDALLARIDTQEELAAAISDVFDIDDAADSLAQLRANSSRLRKTVSDVQTEVAGQNTMRDILRSEAENIIAGKTGTIAATLLGGALGGAPGAAAAGILNIASKPAHASKTLWQLENMAAGSDSRIGKALKSFFEGADAKTAARAFSDTAASSARLAAGASARLGSVSAAVLADRREYRRKAENVLAHAQNPRMLSRALERDLERVSAAAPAVSGHMQALAHRAIAHVASKIPPGLQNEGDFFGAPEEEPVVSDLEIQKLADAMRGVSDPASILDDLADGVFAPEAVEAVKAVYPRLFLQMGEKVMEGLADMQARGKHLPYGKRLQLGLLFDLVTDPSLKPSSVALHQSIHGGKQQREENLTINRSSFNPASAVEQPSATLSDQIVHRRTK
ncbi:MAG: hypothetical protein GWN58_58470 [Anaerolineae bacterium]|nr:hypothetical protein [Anaerolineae bacterium]